MTQIKNGRITFNTLSQRILLILFISLGFYQGVLAQNIGINATGATPAASAMVDIVATDKGLLVPRVSLTATNAAGPVSSPATSLLVYNTATAGTSPNNVIPGYYYWNGSAWVGISTISSTWSTLGNTGLSSTTNFLGHIDDKALVFKANNLSFVEFGTRSTLGLVQGYTDYTDGTEKVTYIRSALQFEAANASFYKPKMFTDTNGNFRVKGSSAGTDFFEFGSTGSSNSGGFEFIIGDDGDEPMVFKSYHYINGMSEIMRLQSGRMAVGSNSFNATNPEKLLIDAGVTTSYNLMTGKGSIDNYLQINVQNSSSGTSASSDVVATADNGSETANYIDMGVNSSAYNYNNIPVLNGANNTYLFGAGNDLKIGNLGNNKSLVFFTTPNATQSNAAERMRITGAGDVGIGTTTPTQKLDLTGNFRLTGAFMPGNSAGTAGYILQSNGAGTSPSWIANTGASGWLLDGNAVSAVKTIGTTSAFDLPFITNNAERMRISSAGDVAIGTATITGDEKLLVNAGSKQTGIGVVGNVNDYLEISVQNTSNGGIASSDLVATANNGTDNSFYVDLGINSANYSNGASNILNGGNLAYLYANAGDMKIGNGTPNKSLMFFTNPSTGSLGTNTANGVERMRILESGNIGIANNAPNSTLSITGSLSMTFRSGSGSYTVLATDYVIINTGAATTWTLPAASTCSGRIYRLVNHGSAAVTLSQSVTTANGTTTTTLPFAATTNTVEILSDGSVWRQIN